MLLSALVPYAFLLQTLIDIYIYIYNYFILKRVSFMPLIILKIIRTEEVDQ